MDLEADVLPGTEGPAHAAERQPDLLRGQAQALGHLELVVVEPLGGHDQVHAAVFGRDGQAGLGAHERLVLHPDLVVTFDHHGAASAGIAPADRQLPEDVSVGMDRCPRGCPGRVEQWLQHLVLHDDGLARPAGRFWVLGRDRGDRFADVADHVGREYRLVAPFEAVVDGGREVVGGHDGVDAGDDQGRRDVDRHDPRRRVGRAQRPAPEHPVGPEVAGEGELPADLRPSVGSGGAVPDSALVPRGDRNVADLAHSAAPSSPAAPARCAAARMRP